MKLLLSAYACEPNVGSEPGIGWRWASEAAKLEHHVTIITRTRNKHVIEAKLEKEEISNISVEYYDLPKCFQWTFWGKRWPFKTGLQYYWHAWHYPYHFFWQLGAYKRALQLQESERFDVVHHITFGTLRRSSFMGKLGLPFIYGPVGGGERAPWHLRVGLGYRGWLTDFIRDLSILMTKANPWIWGTCKRADIIYLKTPDSAYLVPKRYRYKTKVKLEIGIERLSVPDNTMNLKNIEGEHFEVLYVGRFVYWKGMVYGIRAFARLIETCPNARLTIIGKGPDEKGWKQTVKNLGLDDYVRWVPWVEKKDLKRYYGQSDIFLFPSLHDSSGNAVLEALCHGLPVVCFDLGGPAAIVDDSCAIAVRVKKTRLEQVIQAMAEAMSKLALDREMLRKLQKGALERSEQFIWEQVVNDVYKSLPRSKSSFRS